MSAKRLPGKPLLKINGLSIISHVFKRAEKANIGDVYVATEDQEIIDEVNTNGGKAVLTSKNNKTGTDRVFEAFKILGINGIDFIDGNDHYTIGNRINCEFAKTNDRATEDSKTSKLDTKLSGNYLIYRARHIIKPEKYDLSLTMVKLGSRAGS